MNKKFVSNTAWIISGQLIKNILGFVISIFTARFLGPSDFGIIGYVASIVTLFTAFSNLGLGNIIVKEIIANKGREGKVVGTAITLQLISSSIAYLMVIGTVIALNIDDKLMWLCAMLQGFSLVAASFDNIKYYYQSRLESKFVIIISLVAYILVQIYKVVLLFLKKPVAYFAFTNTLDVLVISIALILSYLINKGPRFGFSKDVAKSLLKQSYPFIISGTVNLIYSVLDKIMLKELLGGTASVGYYNVAHTISNAWVFVVAALITSFSPLIYESVHHEGEQGANYKRRVRQMYCAVFWLGAAASIVIDIVAPWLIKLAYGDKYLPAIVPTMILTWAGVLSYLGVARGIQFVCEKKQRYIIYFSICTVIVNVVANYLMIPRFEVIGASVATVISILFSCIIAPMFLKKTRNISFSILKGICFQGVQMREMINLIKRKVFKRNIPRVVVNEEKSEVNADSKDPMSEEIIEDVIGGNTSQDVDDGRKSDIVDNIGDNADTRDIQDKNSQDATHDDKENI